MKGRLLVLCGFAAAVILFYTADVFGVGGPPWYGWWDSTTNSSEPFVLTMAGVAPGGASDKAGLRAGDRIDLRDQTLDGRFARVFQLSAAQPVDLVVRQASHRVTLRILGSPMWAGAGAIKVSAKGLPVVAALWFLVCALLIVLRRSNTADARTIAAIMLLQIPILVRPGVSSVPSAAWSMVGAVISAVSLAFSALLLLRFTIRYGRASALTRMVWMFGYIAIAAEFARNCLGQLGLATLWFDPIPYLAPLIAAHGPYATALNLLPAIQWSVIAISAILAVRSAPREELARAMWLLLPLPIVFLVEGVFSIALGVTSSWFVFSTLIGVYNAFWLLGGFVVTYAILKRRVVDIEFVISRTLVVGIVSLIVVTSFILLEWALGNILAGASHATGIVAGGALALVLGFSMRFIHERVDHAVDMLFFRKRHEDERSLREFAKEAAFMTEYDALLDRAIWNVSHHTDARSAALLVLNGSGYAPARESGDAAIAHVDENDGAVLALKTWNKPLDPHRYDTQVRAALAVPMLSRGQLIGILVLDERAGGEAYAPDEVDALAQFAHGIGSALDNLQSRREDMRFRDAVNDGLAAINRKLDNLGAAQTQ